MNIKHDGIAKNAPGGDNPLITCTRKLEFDAAHRVIGHENKCKYLHGHRYVLEVEFAAVTLDKLGRVLDFGLIKDKLKQWIDDNWDHNTILSEQDIELGQQISKVTGQRVFYLPYNPTAENMALFLFDRIIPEIFQEFSVEYHKVIIRETPNCIATVQK